LTISNVESGQYETIGHAGAKSRFCLEPLYERYSSSELQSHEEQYLRKHRRPFVLSPPSPNLKLVIVVPALNEENAIGQVLRSLCAQSLSHKEFEVIIVDNGSTDSTRQVVWDFVSNCEVTIHLVLERDKGCLKAIRTGMDVALDRLAHVSKPREGIIASVDADDQVGTEWASAVVEIMRQTKADMIRGPTRTAEPLPPKIEDCTKLLADVENRVNGYSELARLRLQELLLETNCRGLPIWLPRITGPNMAISRAAYVCVGGLDPRPPGDQSSHLANPLLRIGGNVRLCDEPSMTLYRSRRRSFRSFAEAGGFGVGFGMGFGDILSRATECVEKQTEIIYPNPNYIEAGLKRIFVDMTSGVEETRRNAKMRAIQFLKAPPDPSVLYHLGASPEKPTYVPILRARESLIEMTVRSGGMDYRLAEMFLMGRELLRSHVLAFEGQWINSDWFVQSLLTRIMISSRELPPHVRQIAESLKQSPNAEKTQWYDRACRIMENHYSRLLPQQS
jgi:glycosyltransferase involved in cell wall biosynthesis